MRTPIPDAIFLDVDGVLIDSVDIKGDVFVGIFADFPDSAEEVLAFHLAQGGLTRELKIQQLLELLSKEPPANSEVSARVRKFTELVVERVIQAPEIPGTHKFLQEWAYRCPLYAVSATPDEELQRILAARGLLPFFRKVRGWPPEKSGLITQEIASGGFEASQCILVGDSNEDYEAAKRASVRFICFGAPGVGARDHTSPGITSWPDFGEAVSEVLNHSAT
jgi:phosphoglycolate phosphatase-like HAD superfamily hydrolase